jgi:hypothetical protein
MPHGISATQAQAQALIPTQSLYSIRISIGKIVLVFTRVSIIFTKVNTSRHTGRWIVLTNLKMFHTGGSPLDPRCEIIAPETDVSHELSTLLFISSS